MHVCPNCFNDIELRSFIEVNSNNIGDCSTCKSKQKSILQITELLDFFEEYFSLFKPDPKGIKLVDLVQNDWDLFRNKNIAQKLIKKLASLISLPYNATKERAYKVSYTSEIINNVSYWTNFKEEIKWKQRFVLPIDSITELGWDNFFDDKVEYTNDEILYRARIQHIEGKPAYPCFEMGSPPKEKVSSGRANPEGIPYLYFSKDLNTTFYEVRALYKDEVSVGKFEIKENEYIYLVDFTEKACAFGGYMSAENLKRYTQKILLKQLISADLSKPIRRYDSEIEYIPTQFICEYIKSTTEAEGIIFSSSLHPGGKNIVLFDSNKVTCIASEKYIVKDFKISAEKV